MQTVVLPTNQETTVTPFPLSWAVLCAVISFSISLIAILQHSGVNLVNLTVLADYPQAFSEYIAEAIGYSFGLPVIHVALASFLKSMRNSNTRRKIFIGWAIVVVIANFSFMAWPGAPTYKPEKSVRASPSSLVKQQESPTIVAAVSARTGQFAISPVFERAGNFSHGLAPVQQGGKWGYIDKAGKMVINLQFGDASSFGANGLARVTVGGSGPEFDWKSGKVIMHGKVGYIDKLGRIVINPQFDQANLFSEKLAAVRIGDYDNGIWGFIDEQGNMVIPPQFTHVGPFLMGLAVAAVRADGIIKFGLIDRVGKFVLDPQFGGMLAIEGGELLAKVLGGPLDNKVVKINSKGAILLQPKYDVVGPFSDGLAKFSVGDHDSLKYGYLNRAGKVAINPQFDSADSFQEGLAAVRIGDDKTGEWGFIDTTGKIVVNPQFSGAIGGPSGFSEGLAAVVLGDYKTGSLGFIDKTGKFVINPQFGLITGSIFSEGLAMVRVGDSSTGKFGFIYR